MSDADTIKALQRVVAEQERELLVLRPQVAALTARTETLRDISNMFSGAIEHVARHLGFEGQAVLEDPSLALTAIAKAVAAEREMCAKVAEAGAVVAEQECAWESAIVLRGVAAAIRARGGQ